MERTTSLQMRQCLGCSLFAIPFQEVTGWNGGWFDGEVSSETHCMKRGTPYIGQGVMGYGRFVDEALLRSSYRVSDELIQLPAKHTKR